MKKTLRFSLLSMLLMLASNVMAQKTVTIDFDNDYQTLFPSLPGVSCSANKDQGIEASSDGDFANGVATTSTAVDGVTVTVTPAEDAKTPSRIWDRAPRLRMYSGTFTVTASEDITKIEFTAGSNYNISTTNGTLDGKVWVGQSKEIVFDIAKNTQINQIVVTLGGTPEVIDPNKKGTQDNPYTVAEAQELLSTLDVNVKTDAVYVKGFISQIDEVDETGQYGNATYYISDTKSTDGQLYVFRGYYLENTKFTSASQIAVGDEVIVTGQLVNYRSTKAAETDPYTPEFTQGNYIYSHNGKTKADGDTPVTPPDTEVKSINVAEALAIIDGLEDSKITTELYQVKGYVISITEISTEQYFNATFVMADSKNATEGLTAFRIKGFEGKDITNPEIVKVGDEVVVQGHLQRFVKNGVMTPEIAQNDGKLISVNGKTSDDGGTPPVVDVKEVSVEQALDIINDELEDGKTTADNYRVSGFVVGTPDFQRKDDGSLFGNVNFEIADEKGGSPTLTVFRAKSFDNVSFTEETINLLKEGDEVVVEGKLQRFVKDGVMTPEVSSCHIYSINGNLNINAIMMNDADNQTVYNLAGQRVVKAQKGLYIVGGKKVIVK
ncbi:MAG: hypothetical protein IJQ76_03605 [Prevotella sp.]|nr:hypothetical protein [Prevotella sp.]